MLLKIRTFSYPQQFLSFRNQQILDYLRFHIMNFKIFLKLGQSSFETWT